MKMLSFIGKVLAIIITYLATIIFLPIFNVKRQPVSKTLSDEPEELPKLRQNIEFIVDGTVIRGWLYRPDNLDKPSPCVILSHGLGGTKDMELEKYALRFTEAGYSVLTYDYRHFGESDGKPRQIYCGLEQLEDLKAAIKYARLDKWINNKRIILWGTSAGASHGIIVASEDHEIAGIVAQCGAYDHKEDNKTGIERDGMAHYLKLFVHGQRDKGRSRFGLSRHMVPTYGVADSFAFIRSDKVFEGVQKLARHSKNFENTMCAAFMLMPHTPDTIECSKQVQCKVLVQVCENDEIVSSKSHVRLVENLKDLALLKKYAIGHFDIYFDEGFEVAVRDQLEFMDNL